MLMHKMKPWKRNIAKRLRRRQLRRFKAALEVERYKPTVSTRLQYNPRPSILTGR